MLLKDSKLGTGVKCKHSQVGLSTANAQASYAVLLSHSSSQPAPCDPMDCSPLGSSVHGTLQARRLEWVAVPSSGDLPHPGIKPGSPALQADSVLLSLWEAPSFVHLRRIYFDAPSCHGENSHFLLVFGKTLGSPYSCTLSGHRMVISATKAPASC